MTANNVNMITRIKAILKKALGKEVGQVFISERPEFGNYSTNAAFILAKEAFRPFDKLRMVSRVEPQAQGKTKLPLEIAKELAAKIKNIDRGVLFQKVEAAPPGFVNFWLSVNALKQELIKILKTEKFLVPGSKFKVNIEFISANPTGPLTMANGRGGFWGDVIANVLESVGHKVTREYYINDAGNQIKILGESILAALGKIPAKEEHYQGDYVKELAKKLKSQIAKRPDGKAIEDPRQSRDKSQSVEDIGRLAATELLKQIKKSVKTAGIKFDVWYSEYEELRSSSRTLADRTPAPEHSSVRGTARTRAEAIKKGSGLDRVLRLLDKKGLVAEHDGAKWLKSSEIADEKDRVLVKSDGGPTYFLSDIAYHYDKFINRKFDKVIDIWGADHHGYVARLRSGVKAIGIDPERLRIIITQMVRLVKKGEEVRMSKRKGEFVTLDELLKEVGNPAPAKAAAGKDAARFFFLTHAPDTHMDFDLELAKERSMKNPVYYVQYAFVRCSSILRKVRSSKFEVRSLGKLSSESELNLIKELIKLPYMIEQTAEDYQVNRLTRYVGEVARAFHNFYEKERVIGESKEIMNARLVLVMATRIILGKLLDLLGIDKPKKM